MRNVILLSMLFWVNLCFAQQTETTLSLKDLEIPISPGFMLLDQAPSSIERPNTARAFTVSVFNSFGDFNGLPGNYAVEFTPFWFFKHPNMNALKYAGYDNKKLRPFSSLKMVSLSFAYVNQTDSITDKPINNIAFGARTNVFKIRSRDNLADLAAANRESVTALKNINEIIVSRIGPGDPTDPVGYRQKQSELLEMLQDSLKNNISEALEQKPVLALDLAVAYSTFFTNNDFSTGRFGRFGTWLTLNYAKSLNKENSNYLNIYALGRYLSDGTSQNTSGEFITGDFVDVGAKVEFEFKQFSVAYEYIQRTNGNTDSFRSTGQLRYKLSDTIYLTGAFGKNFGETNNLVSLLGINWGLNTGNEKVNLE